MAFYYGGFTHPEYEVAFEKIQRTVLWSSTQRANIMRESWSLKGKIVKQGTDAQSQIFSALTATRNAYSVNWQSAGMNGTPFQMNNANAVGGVIVTDRVSHGALMGSETATYLNYTFGLQMDSFLSAKSELLSYSEQLTFSDIFGGPLQVGRVPAVGLPITQYVSTNSFFHATQSGSASSRDPNIQPEEMLFPESLIGEDSARQVTYSSPKMQRGDAIEYGVSWSYKYRQAIPFTGSTVHARG